MSDRFELNFDEDKIIDIEAIGDKGVLELKDCCKIMNEQQATITALNEKIEQRNALLDKIEKALGEPIEEWLLGVKYR